MCDTTAGLNGDDSHPENPSTEFTTAFNVLYVTSLEHIKAVLNTNVPCTFCNLVDILHQHPGGKNAGSQFSAALQAEPRFVDKLDLIPEAFLRDPEEGRSLVTAFATVFFLGGQLILEGDVAYYKPKGAPYGAFGKDIDVAPKMDANTFQEVGEILKGLGNPIDIIRALE